MAKLRVLLADDHAIVREGLKALINGHPDMEVVGEAADGTTAYAKTIELRPAVVVMDLSMPGVNGIQATRDLRRQWPEVRVLALTVHEERSYLRELMEAGAAGYVLKRSAAEDLVHALRVVARGDVYLDPSVAMAVLRARVRAHFEAMLSHYGQETGVRMARKHLGWYSKGLPASAEFRAAVNREIEPAKVRAMLAAFFLPNLERQAA